jgi:hypothetical protein
MEHFIFEKNEPYELQSYLKTSKKEFEERGRF